MKLIILFIFLSSLTSCGARNASGSHVHDHEHEKIDIDIDIKQEEADNDDDDGDLVFINNCGWCRPLACYACDYHYPSGYSETKCVDRR